jgi:Na+-translocating ferredoxin:NAD+ oxidoreductase RnfA subunit
MVNNIFYYVLTASAVLIYGVGLSRVVPASHSMDGMFLSALKMYIVVPSTAVIGWLLVMNILLPAGLAQMFPFICVLLFLSISTFCETLIRITAGRSTAEFSISFLFSLIAVNESTTLTEVLVISLCCVTSFYILVPVLYAMRKRMEFCCLVNDFKNESLIYIGIAVIILTLSAWNISWLNPGVLP